MEIVDEVLGMGPKIEEYFSDFAVVHSGEGRLAFKEEGLVKIKSHKDIFELFHQRYECYYANIK